MMSSVPNTDKEQIERLTEIAIQLSIERDDNCLLEKIVRYARELTNADGGTLYLHADGKLRFQIIQNQSLNIFRGGDGEEVGLPPVEMDRSNVSAFAALERQTVNIADVYESDAFDFAGPRKYDAKTGYRSQSMLVTPMEDHEERLVGVLQLMNAIDSETGETVSFTSEAEELCKALASLAAVALTNTRLILETKALFEALIQVMATAVDAKSHFTGNHVQRVARFNCMIAEAISKTEKPPYDSVSYTARQLEGIRLAGWLHDVGKLSTPEWVMNKSTKLETIFDRINLIKTRFETLKGRARKQGEEEKVAFLKERVLDNSNDPMIVESTLEAIDSRTKEKIRKLEDDLCFIESCNEPGEFLDEDKRERLDRILNSGGVVGEEITAEEHNLLSISKGTLSADEREIMQQHVVWTGKLLEQVPFKGELSAVPLIAAQHHERLNGQGYPDGLRREQLSLPSRILAVADVFEALSAKDRPYRKSLPVSKVVEILKRIAQEGELDEEIVAFIEQEQLAQEFEVREDARSQ